MQDRLYSESAKGTSPDAIPEALRSRAQWMGTIFERRADGKTNKPPYRVRLGLPIVKADKTSPENWSTFTEARAALERGDVDGLGYVVSADDPFYAVDCDHVVDPESGEIEPAAYELVEQQDTYSELSCSRSGLHIFGEGVKPDFAECRTKRLGFGVEVYDAAAFIVMTGERLLSTPGEPQHRQREFTDLCHRLWPKQGRFSQRKRRPDPVHLDDAELLERARRSRTGKKFRQLYDAGDISGYPSASEGDFALINHLIFWCGGDASRIVRLFELSALHRPKEKRGNYVERSVTKALADYSGKFYRPRRIRQTRSEERREADPLVPFLKLLLTPAAWTGRRGASAYKAFTAMVIRASEDGIVDDDGNLRIGADTRTLSEIAGMSRETLRSSALPYLTTERKLIRWHRGKGRRSGVFVLQKSQVDTTWSNKVATHFIGPSYADHETGALRTLKLLIRMRSGCSKTAKLMRLGMGAMFTTIALVAGPPEQSLEELAERTGRRKSALRKALVRLKAQGIARERRSGLYSLTDHYVREYQRVLDQSGITYAEREQRRRHRTDREVRDAKLPIDKQKRPLRAKEYMSCVIKRNIQREHERWAERERAKVGMTASVFLSEELDGEYGPRVSDTLDRWRILHKGKPEEIWAAIRHGPFVLRRVSGDLYIDPAVP
jgi:putative DNA primase/helicase